MQCFAPTRWMCLLRIRPEKIRKSVEQFALHSSLNFHTRIWIGWPLPLTGEANRFAVSDLLPYCFDTLAHFSYRSLRPAPRISYRCCLAKEKVCGARQIDFGVSERRRIQAVYRDG